MKATDPYTNAGGGGGGGEGELKKKKTYIEENNIASTVHNISSY